MRKFVLLVGVLVALAACVPGVEAATDAEIQTAIDSGIVWLAAQQDSSDGHWGEEDYETVGKTAFAVKKLEHHCVDSKWGLGLSSPFDPACPYREQIIEGFNYIFAHACTVSIGTQTHDADVDDPDTDHDGIGVYFEDVDRYSRECDIYTTGVALMAIVESRHIDREVDVPDSDVDGWTYRDVAVDAMNYLAWAQTDNGNGRGGWDYEPQDNAGPNSDNSISGYAVLGLAYASSPPR